MEVAQGILLEIDANRVVLVREARLGECLLTSGRRIRSMRRTCQRELYANPVIKACTLLTVYQQSISSLLSFNKATDQLTTMFSTRMLSILALALSGASILAAAQTTCEGGGSIDCCTTTYEQDSYEARMVVSALKIDNSSLPEGMVATACGGGGVNVGGGSTCENIPVCCLDNYFGVIGVGCSPIPISL